jgi:hypothetical protein
MTGLPYKAQGKMALPSGLGRISVQILALRFHILGHSTLTRASFHLKTRQEYFLHDKESFGMLKSRYGGTWFSTLFGTPFALINGNGPKWGIWPSTAPFCPIFVAMTFSIEKYRQFI